MFECPATTATEPAGSARSSPTSSAVAVAGRCSTAIPVVAASGSSVSRVRRYSLAKRCVTAGVGQEAPEELRARLPLEAERRVAGPVVRLLGVAQHDDLDRPFTNRLDRGSLDSILDGTAAEGHEAEEERAPEESSWAWERSCRRK